MFEYIQEQGWVRTHTPHQVYYISLNSVVRQFPYLIQTLSQGFFGFRSTETLLYPTTIITILIIIRETGCSRHGPVVSNISSTISADPAMSLVILHQESQAAGNDTVMETFRVSVDSVVIGSIQNLTIPVALWSSPSTAATLRIVLQFKYLRLALTSCWSGGRSSFFDEMFSKDSSTDDSSEDG